MNESILLLALKNITKEFDRFIDECLNEDESIKPPSKNAIMRARGCLPSYCKHSYKRRNENA